MNANLEPCGQHFGPHCPMLLAQSWTEETQTYMSDDGGEDTGRRIDAATRVERAYNRNYGCTTRCAGLREQRAETKRWHVDRGEVTA